MSLQSLILRRSEMGDKGIARRAGLRPKARRYTAETLPDRELLALSILNLWLSDYTWYVYALQTDARDLWPAVCTEIWSAPTDFAVKMALGRALRILADHMAQVEVSDPNHHLGHEYLKVIAYVPIPLERL